MHLQGASCVAISYLCYVHVIHVLNMCVASENDLQKSCSRHECSHTYVYTHDAAIECIYALHIWFVLHVMWLELDMTQLMMSMSYAWFMLMKYVQTCHLFFVLHGSKCVMLHMLLHSHVLWYMPVGDDWCHTSFIVSTRTCHIHDPKMGLCCGSNPSKAYIY
jgi:hypothetical protein